MNNSTTNSQSTNLQTADVVICGAGIAGVAAAHWLTVEHGIKRVVLVDERAPLTLTSDKSTEAYRNWWLDPDGAMMALMNRSIDLLEAVAHRTDNRIRLNRRGYLYATANPHRAAQFRRQMAQAEKLGAGEMRFHTGAPTDPTYRPPARQGFQHEPGGADLITDPTLIRTHFPFLSEETIAVLHARRCGWFSGYQLGMTLLEEARAHGAEIITGRVTGVRLEKNRVRGVTVAAAGGTATIATETFVNAAGPFLKNVGQMMGIDLPVFSELHLKVSIKDRLGIIPRDAPLTIWTDPQRLPWSSEAREFLAADAESRWLLSEFPGTLHFRPEGEGDSPVVLMLFPYHTEPVAEVFPLPTDPNYPEVVLRGMVTMVPAMAAYLQRMPQPYVDGGYYTKTKENRPLVGALPVDGGFVIGALSGFGLMASLAAGELLAASVTGSTLPPYAAAFAPNRYDDPEYRQFLQSLSDENQL